MRFFGGIHSQCPQHKGSVTHAPPSTEVEHKSVARATRALRPKCTALANDIIDIGTESCAQPPLLNFARIDIDSPEWEKPHHRSLALLIRYSDEICFVGSALSVILRPKWPTIRWLTRAGAGRAILNIDPTFMNCLETPEPVGFRPALVA